MVRIDGTVRRGGKNAKQSEGHTGQPESKSPRFQGFTHRWVLIGSEEEHDFSLVKNISALARMSLEQSDWNPLRDSVASACNFCEVPPEFFHRF